MFRLQLAVLLLASSQFAAADEWKEIKSQEGNFKVQFPGESKYSSREIDTELGKIKLHMFMLAVNSGNTVLVIMYSDYPDELFDRKTTAQLLVDAMNGAVQKVNGKLQSETNVTHDNFPGKDIEVKSTKDDQTTYFNWRLLLVKNRMYQIGCVGVGNKVPAETVKKIKESFQLLR